MRTDPTDTGGLFVRRRPGTAPVRYRDLPDEGTARRRRADAVLAHALLGLMVVVNLLFWGPLPAALAVARRRGRSTSRTTSASGSSSASARSSRRCSAASSCSSASTRAGSSCAARRAIDQRSGVLPRVFGTTAVVAAVGFTGWLVFIGGLGSSVFTGQG